MSAAKRIFLLPCAGCGRDLEVVTGQAGGRVECGGCGRVVDVPKLRDLGTLPLKQDTGPGHTPWGTAQSVMLAAIGVAVVFFRWRQTDPRLRPSRAWDVLLWASAAGFVMVGIWTAWQKLQGILAAG